MMRWRCLKFGANRWYRVFTVAIYRSASTAIIAPSTARRSPTGNAA